MRKGIRRGKVVQKTSAFLLKEKLTSVTGEMNSFKTVSLTLIHRPFSAIYFINNSNSGRKADIASKRRIRSDDDDAANR